MIETGKEFPMIETLLSCLVLIIVVAVAWWLVKFVFKLAGCVLYGVLVAIVAVGLLIILGLFVF